MKVAIVGGGPRGLWAAESLLYGARAHEVPVDLTVFEPGELGAGSAYSTSQPAGWRLNAPSHIVHTHVGSFDQWRTDGDDPFPPRALVGEFLAYSWQQLLKDFPTTTVVPEEVTDVAALSKHFDHVLVVTGHIQHHPGELPGTLKVYPHAQLDAIAPGSHVAVRGASLTFIDAALYLDSLPADRRPAKVSVHSRSGRFMEAKHPLGNLDFSTASKNVLLSENMEQLREALIGGALEVLATARALKDSDRAEIERVLDGQDFTGDAVAELRRSVRGEPCAAWALGMVWRGAYEAVCTRVRGERRKELPGFYELSRTLERVAFGPPPVNAQKLLDLIDSGFVDTTQMTTPVTVVGADVVVDAVLAPQGMIEGSLYSRMQEIPDNVTVISRENEDMVLGHDTLSRTLNSDIPQWATRVISEFTPPKFDAGVEATVPLSARLEPWEANLATNPQRCTDVVEEFGSPTNVVNPAPMGRNIAELVDAGAAHGVDVKVFYARKANKALCFVDEVLRTGHGVDVASHRELEQVLSAGMPGHRIICSAAIKPDSMLDLAISHEVPISVDSVSELRRIGRVAESLGTVALVAPRIAPDPTTMPPTRFGERLATWQDALPEAGGRIAVVGVHAHMHGYDEKDRRLALGECVQLIDTARARGHAPEFVDLGGGVPMSYLDSAEQWDNYQQARTEMMAGEREPFTWKADPLTNTYPFHQSPTRGAWLDKLLSGAVNGSTGARELISRGLRLHLEPGRSILDGCGMILAEVAFVKHRADGLPLVGLAMNRTQCRTNTDDILLDPILVRTSVDTDPESAWTTEVEAFLVGAYCIEDELIIRRRMRFPNGVKAGDIIAIPNTAGYFMHILESASHQIPLAKNVVYPQLQIDAIDR